MQRIEMLSRLIKTAEACDTFGMQTWSERQKEWGPRIPGSSVLDEEFLTKKLLRGTDANQKGVPQYQFTRKEEATTGADWEWWIGGGTRWRCLRFQAKPETRNAERHSTL